MSNDREKIVSRIKKLLELAENTGATEAEATAAALAAQRLIAQNDVEQWEIHSIDAEPIGEARTNQAPRRWRCHLASIVAPAFRCECYQNTEWNFEADRRETTVVFYGYKSDATAAAITFNTLYKIGNRLASRFSRNAERGSYNAYVLGFVNGVRLELEKQTEALMIVVPPKVKEAFDSEYGDMERASGALSVAHGEDAYTAYQNGIEEGRNAVQSHRFDASEAADTAPAYAALTA